uniref:Uncharacterized protein n=1 Tax=Ciona intestinalis TaxID=7719 RepID=H2Y132_CIOIN
MASQFRKVILEHETKVKLPQSKLKLMGYKILSWHYLMILRQKNF